VREEGAVPPCLTDVSQAGGTEEIEKISAFFLEI